MKNCSTCKVGKPTTDFGTDKRRRDGLSCQCRECMRNSYRLWARSNPEKVQAKKRRQWRSDSDRINTLRRERKSHLKYLFGLPIERYEAMIEAQQGKCAICACVPKDALCVDHDHLTGNIRALLCRKCNAGIGLLGDDLDRLRAAVRYLEGH